VLPEWQGLAAGGVLWFGAREGLAPVKTGHVAGILEDLEDMGSVAFVIPRQEGKEDHSRELVAELTGSRGAAVHARRNEHGFSRIKVWHQDQPMKVAIVYLEADDLDGAIANMSSDPNEHNVWVSNMIESISGHHPHKADTRPA